MMDVFEVIRRRRSIRSFKQKPVEKKILEEIVDAARLAPSAANLQPCEYIVVDDKKIVEGLFSTLKWAGYIAPAGDPPPGKRPTAYIAVLLNRKKRKAGGERDAAAAMENMILAALEKGIGSCWVGSIDRRKLSRILEIPSHCAIDSVLAIGYPDEEPAAEEMTDSIEYYKDEDGHLHIPKRRFRDIIHFDKY